MATKTNRDKIKKYLVECENDNILNCLYNKIPPSENKNSKISNNTDDSNILVEFIKKNQSYVKSEYFKNKHAHLIKFDSHNEAEQELLNEISDFIETGILINE